jgi:hypothetical protein
MAAGFCVDLMLKIFISFVVASVAVIAGLVLTGRR